MQADSLKWIGHASFLIKIGEKNVYVDPFKLSAVNVKADLILITHPHFDHMNMEDIAKIADSNTEIFVTQDSVDKISIGKVKGVEPNRSYSSSVLRFATIPAYNVIEERLDKHPKKNGWVGYVIEAEGTRIYHAGDTDFIPEMEKLSVDLALIPMGGTYTMNTDEAIVAAKAINAAEIAPMHYRAVLGHKAADAAEKKFVREVKNARILKEVQEPFTF